MEKIKLRATRLSIYATNGPGRANSLFANQLTESGEVTFIDVSASSGAGVASQDSTGVCFADIISVSASDYFNAPLVDYPIDHGGPYDDTGTFFPTFSETSPGSEAFVWNQFEQTEGTISVQVNKGDNGNRWVRVRTLGTVGITSSGVANRDGIGTVVQFTPKNGGTAMKPIAGGGSNYSSQDSTDAIFGLGGQSKGPLDVLWSDGVHNRLYKAEKGQTIVFPEIPCDFKADWADDDYEDCVENALDKLRDAGLLTKKEAKRFEKSANRAYDEEHDD